MTSNYAVQGLLPISSSIDFIKALAASRKVKKVKRAQRKAIKFLRESLLKLIAMDQLDLFAPASAESAQEIQQREEERALWKEVATNWKDEEVVLLADSLIVRTLELIRDSTNDNVKRELITWFAPSSDPDEPFSMAFWCRIAGHDPMEYSKQIRRIYREDINRWLGIAPTLKAPAKVYRTLFDEPETFDEEQKHLCLAWD